MTSVADDVARWDIGRVVLVAHSFSGVLVPAVAEQLAGRVAAIVLVGASAPLPGKAWIALLPMPQRILLRVLYAVRPAGMLSPDG